MGSIESVFLVNSQFILDQFPRIGWYRSWYFGFPFGLTYQPIPIFLPAIITKIFGISIGSAYRWMLGVGLALGPFTSFYLLRYLTKNFLAGLIGALVFAILPSVGYLIPEVGNLASEFDFLPWRMVAGIHYGEGPHILGLSLVPLGLLLFLKTLRSATHLRLIGTVLVLSAILLTSLTAFVFAIFWLLIAFVIELSKGKWQEKLKLALWILILTFGVSFFWYNPAFIKAAIAYSTTEGGGIFSGLYSNKAIVLSLVVPLIAIFVVFVAPFIKKRGNFWLWFLSLASFFVLLGLIWGWYTWRIALLPFPYRTIPRLIPELELLGGILAGVVSASVLRSLSKTSASLSLILGIVLVVGLLLIGVWRAPSFQKISSSHGDIQSTSEYQVSDFLKNRVGRDERVYATGTHAFWLNVFAPEVIQLRGGKGGDFGGLNQLWAHVNYQLYNGDDPEIARLWLEALGIKYAVVNFPNSLVYFHDFGFPYKFNEFANPIFEFEGDKVYEINLAEGNQGLAVAADKAVLKEITGFYNAPEGRITLDKDKLSRYLAALKTEEKIEANYREDGQSIEVLVKDPKPEAIVLRVSFDKGWRIKGREGSLGRDPMGFILLMPEKEGKFVLEFKNRTSYLSWLVSIIGLAILLGGPSVLKKEKSGSGKKTQNYHSSAGLPSRENFG